MDCVKSFSESLCRGGNYDFKYKRRTGEDKADGLCMFWNKSRWTRVHYVDVEFYRYDEDPLMDRHNVAQICVLKELSSGNMILIANTHLLFNPKRGDVKIRQLEILLKEISNVREKFDRSDNKFCVLLMGDFNAVPGSAMYELLSKGRLSLRNLDRKLISGQWNPKTMHEWKEIKWTFDTRHLGRGTCMRVFRSEKRTGDTKPRSCDGIDVDVEKEDKKNFLKHELSLHSAYSESATTKSTWHSNATISPLSLIRIVTDITHIILLYLPCHSFVTLYNILGTPALEHRYWRTRIHDLPFTFQRNCGLYLVW